MGPRPTIRHAGLIARRLGGFWRGVLIEGPSGAGKSDLALRALSQGWDLVADDRTLVFLSGGRVFGRAPAPLRGRLEIRGLGILPTACLDVAEIGLIVRLVPPATVARLPKPGSDQLLGVAICVLELSPLESSATAKLNRAIEHLGARRQGGYDASFAPPPGHDGT